MLQNIVCIHFQKHALINMIELINLKKCVREETQQYEYLCKPLYVISRHRERSVFIFLRRVFLPTPQSRYPFIRSPSLLSSFSFRSMPLPPPPLLTFTSGCKTAFEQRRFFLMQIEFFLILAEVELKAESAGATWKIFLARWLRR